MKESLRRTLLFAFWPETVRMASSTSTPRSIISRALCSSLRFQLMKSRTSGWSTSKTTILAARLVVPPDLVAPAALSSTSRKDMRPDEVPPPESLSSLERIRAKFDPVPEPYLKSLASFLRSWKIDMRSSLTLWMKQAEHCGY